MNQAASQVQSGQPRAHHRPVVESVTSFGSISSRSSRLHRGGFLLFVGISLLGLFHLYLSDSTLIGTYSFIAATTLAGLYYWISQGKSGLPFLPLFVIQQGVIYALPLVVGDTNLDEIPDDIAFQSGISVALLLSASILGHRIGRRFPRTPVPSRWNFFPRQGPEELRRATSLAILMLVASVVFHLATRSGLLYQLLPGSLWRFFPVIRALADASALFGALIGGLSISLVPHPTRKLLYWSLLLAIFFLSIADVLLSAATGLILATAVGLALGKGRFPLVFLALTFSLLGFLNQGKFTVREKYWDSDSNTTQLAVSQLPSFYADWAATSAEALFTSSRPSIRPEENRVKIDGQSLLDRIDNFQILAYVVEAISEDDAPLLEGKTYTLIPPLLVPRFLWPEKPRTHEGQILLNLHFKRQKSVEETEKTYIAWGLLPESIGNFGVYLGPIILGFLFGTLMGWLETYSLRKQIFSIEGVVLVALLLKIITSFEMVSSVFVTSTFQFLVIVSAGGFILHKLFKLSRTKESHPRFGHRFAS